MFLQHSNITIFGMTGSGKSYLCRQLQEYFPNVFIFDTLYEYSSEDGLILNTFEEFSDFVIKTKNQNGFKVIIRFNIDHDNFELINEYLKLLYFRGNCTIVLEEAQNFATIHKIPIYLKHISLTGRHKKVNFISTTQRIAEIHKSLISQAHNIFSGFTDSPNDINTLKTYGFNIQLLEKIQDKQFIWKRGREYYYIDNDLNFFSS